MRQTLCPSSSDTGITITFSWKSPWESEDLHRCCKRGKYSLMCLHLWGKAAEASGAFGMLRR